MILKAISTIITLFIFSISHANSFDINSPEYFAYLSFAFARSLTVPQQYTSATPRFSTAIRIDFPSINVTTTDSQTCTTVGNVIMVQYFSNNSFVQTSYGCTEDDIFTEYKANYVQMMIQEVGDYFNSVLNVLDIRNLQVANNKTARHICGFEDDTSLPTLISSIDLMVHITTRKSVYGLSVIPCQVDQYGRPTVIVFNIDPASVIHINSTYIKQAFFRSFGFTKSVLERGFIQWGSTITQWTYVPYLKLNGTSIPLLKLMSPTVVSTLRGFFNCSSLDGGFLVDLKDNDVFWFSKFFRNEILSFNVEQNPTAFLTLAALADSGWYGLRSNLLTTSPVPHWGKGMGCSFLNDDCVSWPLADTTEGYICPSNSIYTDSDNNDGNATENSEIPNPGPIPYCTFDLQGIGSCPAYPPYQFGCPVVVTSSPLFYCTNADPEKIVRSDLGEYFGTTSRCFVTTLSRSSTPSSRTCACYDTYCTSPTTLKIQVDSTWYDCPSDGSPIPVIGYSGMIKCSPMAIPLLCSDAKADTTWPIITSVVPNRGSAGIQVQVIGENFGQRNLSVTFREFSATIISVTRFSLTVIVPADNMWNSAAHFAGSESVPVVIKDDQGRTFVLQNGYTVVLSSFDGIWIWMVESPGWAVLAVILFTIVLILLIVPCVFFLPKIFHSSGNRLRKIARDMMTLDSLRGGTVSTVNLDEVWERAQATHAPMAFDAKTIRSRDGDLEGSMEFRLSGSMRDDPRSHPEKSQNADHNDHRNERGSVRIARVDAEELDASENQPKTTRGPGNKTERSWRTSMSFSKVDLEGSMVGVSPRRIHRFDGNEDDDDDDADDGNEDNDKQKVEDSDSDSSNSGIWDVEHGEADNEDNNNSDKSKNNGMSKNIHASKLTTTTTTNNANKEPVNTENAHTSDKTIEMTVLKSSQQQVDKTTVNDKKGSDNQEKTRNQENDKVKEKQEKKATPKKIDGKSSDSSPKKSESPGKSIRTSDKPKND